MIRATAGYRKYSTRFYMTVGIIKGVGRLEFAVVRFTVGECRLVGVNAAVTTKISPFGSLEQFRW